MHTHMHACMHAFTSSACPLSSYSSLWVLFKACSAELPCCFRALTSMNQNISSIGVGRGLKHILPHVILKHFIKLMVGGHFREQGLLESAGSISMEEMKVKVQEGRSQTVS